MEQPERLHADLVRLLDLPRWWDVLPGSPWTGVAHLFSLTLQEKLKEEHREKLVPLLQSRDPLVREGGARLLKKLGWRPERRIETARYVVAKRNLKAVQHLANKIPRVLREVLPAERFMETQDGKWVFLPADDRLPDLQFAVQALAGIPPASPSLELLLEICACSTRCRQDALTLLKAVPADDPSLQTRGVQVRLQHLLNLYWLPDVAVLRRLLLD
ncbi:hypothetical protein [Deinococcus roseus]|uniref:HEAT repeat domain-containing protein n=1 Tax=Deinococcus roseus TaxID=392414 RepID=A0ABQ2CZU4_9DEIO|nr:hypothetical protein [Deinococcus roseus]GGJ36917.1 hypothetical protein GCM10008938_23700 [Deinococcus roseus]